MYQNGSFNPLIVITFKLIKFKYIMMKLKKKHTQKSPAINCQFFNEFTNVWHQNEIKKELLKQSNRNDTNKWYSETVFPRKTSVSFMW